MSRSVKNLSSTIHLTDTRIELDEEGFGVACRTRAHLLVRRVLLVTVGVAHLRFQDTRDALVGQLDAPETACSRGGGGGEA